MIEQTKQPKVAIIIVNWNNKRFVKSCLNSIKKMTDYKNYKVIVSDNGSTDSSIEMVKKEFKWVDLLKNNANIYWAGGNNIGIKYALKKYNSDYYFLLNDDTKIIQKDWLNKMVETAESDPKIGIVGCKLIYPDGSLQHLGGYMNGPLMTVEKKEDKKIKEVDHVMGSAIMIKREVIDKIGLIDMIFTPYLLDETDYCLRAKKTGFKVISDRRVKIIHYKGITIKKTGNKSQRLFVRGKTDIAFSIINLSIINALLRIFFYLPLVFLLRKREEKKDISLKNIRVRENCLINLLVLVKAYFYWLIRIGTLLKKRSERKRNMKLWYTDKEILSIHL